MTFSMAVFDNEGRIKPQLKKKERGSGVFGDEINNGKIGYTFSCTSC